MSRNQHGVIDNPPRGHTIKRQLLFREDGCPLSQTCSRGSHFEVSLTHSFVVSRSLGWTSLTSAADLVTFLDAGTTFSAVNEEARKILQNPSELGFVSQLRMEVRSGEFL